MYRKAVGLESAAPRSMKSPKQSNCAQGFPQQSREDHSRRRKNPREKRNPGVVEGRSGPEVLTGQEYRPRHGVFSATAGAFQPSGLASTQTLVPF
jgi:hypothetical protein